jgi:uncharacterized membrane protein required for colicin V production
MNVNPEIVNIALVALLAIFTGWGIGKGLIRAVGGIIALIISAAIASRFYPIIADFVYKYIDGYSGLVNILSFILLFVIIGTLANIVVSLVERAFNLVAFLPLLKSLNRLLGGLFGLILGIIFVGAILFIIGKYSTSAPINDSISHSLVAQWINSAAWPVKYFFPAEILSLHSYF